VELRAALSDRDDAQLRAVRELRARVPSRVAELLRAAFRAVRAVEGRLLDDGRCLVRVARHFADTWRAHVKKARTLSQKVRERDSCRCQVPGCSRRAVHAHHITPRSRGGGDERENLVGLCAFHHLVGIHGGYLRVSGRAPGGLTWEIGPRHAPVDLRRRLGLEAPRQAEARAA
jgi:5-methylcytosine-specific restriction endonuclease McrA